jgi:hypothetical protein
LVIIEIRLDRGLGIESEAKLKEKLAEVKKPFWDDHDVPIPVALVRVNRVLRFLTVGQLEFRAAIG